MKDNNLYLGETLLSSNDAEVSFETVELDHEKYFKIENYHQMPPFFMTIVSDVDFWIFVSSTGGITAGRKNPETALFPYYTDDKIHDSHETTGSHTALIVSKADKNYLWKPFSSHDEGVYKITRNLYKNTLGNKIRFEEINHDLNLTFKYTWETSNQYGIIKASELINTSTDKTHVRVLDGIRNILPYGVDINLQTTRSTLVDGYKRSEMIPEYGLGIYTLSSIISDRAEPSESLKATSVWSIGLDHPTYLLSENQVHVFCKNEAVVGENDIKGKRGAYYLESRIKLTGQESRKWVTVSELCQSASQIEALKEEIKTPKALVDKLESDVLKGDLNLKKLVYQADGFQMTANENLVYRHFSNTLYNIMRGGIYASGYSIQTSDLRHFIKTWNKEIFVKHFEYLNALTDDINYFDLIARVEKRHDIDLLRLVREYLPLTYSRRHGDPSRPWNKFNIEISQEDGSKNLNFEGNWRDIFQNWEALSLSYPGYVESIILKFVNASTADGYNPYRITKAGVDWELLDESDPWSNIGYWGDHQVIYLLKLMEVSHRYNPNQLSQLLSQDIFVYANVPYRIKGLDALIKDPKNTIVFDETCEADIHKRVEKLGSDGKLVFVNDSVYHVNLIEKLMVVILAKLSNYIPRGGIWMNTQRPEWNDANNALVGNGVSMVTLYYLYRFLTFFRELLGEMNDTVSISKEVVEMFEGIYSVFDDKAFSIHESMSDSVRLKMVKKLGKIGENYREKLYIKGFTGEKESVTRGQLQTFSQVVMDHLKDTIHHNKRQDGLYNAYNLVTFTDDECQISYLYEMLEGQVAAISSKALDSEAVLSVLKALRESPIYRQDQNSYMLYPVRDLPRFLEKNIISEEQVNDSTVLKTEISKGNTRFIERDIKGHYHFNGRFRNAGEIVDAIRQINDYSEEDVLVVGQIFTAVFGHHSFTGRSGTFYKYEGLGCIYWHMVSKLVLAVEEHYNEAVSQGMTNQENLERLKSYFHEIRSGLGVEKSPVEYGAFPTDAYSHTPGFAGVQQPGMTGQVKEDIISRWGELGVKVVDGQIEFAPHLLSKTEFIETETQWQLPNQWIDLQKNQLAFTVCTVPVIYERTYYKAITVYHTNGDKYTFENTLKLNKELSQSLFKREGKIDRIVVKLGL